MSNRETMERIALEEPICEYAFGSVDQVPFSDKVWYICKTDCERYGHSWACPPYCCEDINELIAKVKGYEHFLLISTVTEVENAWDTEVCLAVKKEHEDLARRITGAIKASGIDVYTLSVGCMNCDSCACPDEPCRHPEDRIQSMESHGIVVIQIADEMGLTTSFGSDSVVYFSMFFYNESD